MTSNKVTVVTLQAIRNWIPVTLSILGLGIAMFNYIADTQTRLTVLEMTVEKNIGRRIDLLEQDVNSLQADVNELQRRNP